MTQTVGIISGVSRYIGLSRYCKTYWDEDNRIAYLDICNFLVH